jgi:hypothetical protein
LGCFFDDEAQGYRCGRPEVSPCGVLNDLGECHDGRASWCDAGEVIERSCSECFRSPLSGQIICAT